jgi:predicted porin
MKTTVLAALFAGTFSSLAQAQSSVDVYGTIDGGLRQMKNVNAAGDSRLSIGSNGTYFPNRLGFRGKEELGGGTYVRFNMETGFNTGTGVLESSTGYFGNNNPSPFTGNGALFQRASTVGVGGAWGVVDVGRQLSVSFKTMNLYDPFGFKYPAIIPISSAAAGAGISQAAGGSRFSNDVQYTGLFGPLVLRAEWSLGEVAAAASTNSAQAIGANYVYGGAQFGVAYTRKKVGSTAGLAAGAAAVAGPPAIAGAAAATAASRTYDVNALTAGAAYSLGAVRLSAGFNGERVEGAVGSTSVAGLALTPSFHGEDYRVRMGWAGAEYKLTSLIKVTGAWYQSRYDTPTATAFTTGKENLFIVGGIYTISKRTTAYADVDYKRLAGNRMLGFGTLQTQDHVMGVSSGISLLF